MKSLLGTCLIILVSMSAMAKDLGYVKPCRAQDGGTFAFGEAPVGCEASDFGDADRAVMLYPSLIFDRNQTDPQHRRNYVTTMHAYLRDLAAKYILRRNPQVRVDEVEAWVQAVLAQAMQESVWSHYRFGNDGHLKLMLGDPKKAHGLLFYRSHGLMQINQEFHASREDDRSFDIVGNTLFGLDFLYSFWLEADKTSCVNANAGREQYLLAKTRAAYSAYNTGGSLCRWATQSHLNDKNYFKKHSEKEWLQYIDNPKAASPIDSACVLNGENICTKQKSQAQTFLTTRPAQYEDGVVCVQSKKGRLTCARDLNLFWCTGDFDSAILNKPVVRLRGTSEGVKAERLTDNVSVCREQYPFLARAGEYVRPIQNLKIRSEVNGGRIMGTALAGRSYQILDYKIQKIPEQSRIGIYYYIAYDARNFGYVLARTTTEDLGFLNIVNTPTANSARLIPQVGDRVVVVNKSGVQVRDNMNEEAELIEKVPYLSSVQIKKVFSLADGFYALVDTKKQNEGYIYIGQTYPAPSFNKWVRVIQ